MDVLHFVIFVVSCIVFLLLLNLTMHTQMHLDCKNINETEQEQGHVLCSIAVFVQLNDFLPYSLFIMRNSLLPHSSHGLNWVILIDSILKFINHSSQLFGYLQLNDHIPYIALLSFSSKKKKMHCFLYATNQFISGATSQISSFFRSSSTSSEQNLL